MSEPAPAAVSALTRDSLYALMIETADTARLAADQAELLRRHFQQALLVLLPVGSVIDLRPRRDMPSYLARLSTVRGNDRGSKLFRIERVGLSNYNAVHPGLSELSIEATPISMTTGKEMSGVSGGKSFSSKTTIRLAGMLDDELMTVVFGEQGSMTTDQAEEHRRQNFRQLAALISANQPTPAPAPDPTDLTPEA
jgi:hypothetical protein